MSELNIIQQLETSVLGCIIRSYETYESLEEKVSADDFLDPDYKVVVKALGAMSNKNIHIDIVTVCEYLKTNQLLDDEICNDIESITLHAPYPGNMKHYIERLKEITALRKLKSILMSGISSVNLPEHSTSREIADTISTQIMQLSVIKSEESKIFHSADGIAEYLEQFHKVEECIGTGFADLDQKLGGGFKKGYPYIVAGRPGMGKSNLALNFIESALHQKKHVLFFSIEMPIKDVLLRMLASLTSIPVYKLKDKSFLEDSMNAKETAAFSSAMNLFDKSNFFIDENSSLTILRFREKLKLHIKRHGIPDLVVVDYLQNMSSGEVESSKVNETTKISSAMRCAAKDYNFPLILLSQLNRGSDMRQDKRPFLSDLRDSGSIEQDAFAALFIHRPSYYDKNLDPNEAEIIVAKNREGQTGDIRISFQPQFCRFLGIEHAGSPTSFTPSQKNWSASC